MTEKRQMTARSSFAISRASFSSEDDTDSEKERDREKVLPFTVIDTRKQPSTESGGTNNYSAGAALLMYSFFSISMVLSNKAISATLDPSLRSKMPQMSIILYQNVLAVVLVELAKFLKFIEYPNFQLSVAYSWLPMNALFVSMLCSGFLSLCYVNVPMVQTFKNLTNILNVFGDWYFFGELASPLSVVAIFLMTIGAVFAGINDLQFNLVGYFWMIMNCICTACKTA
jgi:hypothetical protein